MYDFNSSFNNTVTSFDYLANGPLQTLLFESSTVVCIFGSVLLIYLIKKRLEGLNSLIKSIMYFMAAQSFLANLTYLIFTLIMSYYEIKTIVSCAIILLSKAVRRIGILLSLALISQIRYYIALRTSQTKSYKKSILKYIIVAVLVVGLGGYIATFAIFALNDMVPLVSICSGSPDSFPEKIPIFAIVTMSYAIIIILANLISDISMLIFIYKRRKKVNPTQLIPWKSASKKEENDMEVPVHATILSTLSFIIMTSIIVFFQKLFEAGPIFHIILWSLNQLWICFVIPYVMLLKIIKTKKPQPVIPQGLQMHDEEEDDENNDNNDNKTLDIEQNLQPSTSKNAKSMKPQGSPNCIEDDDESDVDYKNEIKDEEKFTQLSTSKKLQTDSQMYGEYEESDNEYEIKDDKQNKELSISKMPKDLQMYDDENDIKDKGQNIQLSNMTNHLEFKNQRGKNKANGDNWKQLN